MFNWQDLWKTENLYDSEMPWLRQSWPSLGKALEIKRLKAKLEKTRHKPGLRNTPGRQCKKKGYTKYEAWKAYIKKKHQRDLLPTACSEC